MSTDTDTAWDLTPGIALGATFTPCTPKHGDRCSPAHARLMSDWQDARAAWELRREVETSGYATEVAEWNRDNGVLSFPRWLKMHRATVDAVETTRTPSARAVARAERKAWNRGLADAARTVSPECYREVMADWEYAQAMRDNGATVSEALAAVTGEH